MSAADFAASLVFSGVCATAGALGAVYLPRWLARIDLSRLRIIPPPSGDGRWQVWAVSRYPAGGEYRVGRYRARWVARRIAAHLNDGPDGAVRRFEIRRTRTSKPARQSDELEQAMDDVMAAHTAQYHPGRGCIENEAGECRDRFGGPARRPR
ncbi:hypothetical protein ABZY58_11045 [Micromonospora tulbaghiae]|uniref:hypothetical protein n=1 Tax=Micromonospora tulbaghiae TaxID=479978 RepID=UPI0033A40DBE